MGLKLFAIIHMRYETPTTLPEGALVVGTIGTPVVTGFCVAVVCVTGGCVTGDCVTGGLVTGRVMEPPLTKLNAYSL